jgi:hypothetical protein
MGLFRKKDGSKRKIGGVLLRIGVGAVVASAAIITGAVAGPAAFAAVKGIAKKAFKGGAKRAAKKLVADMAQNTGIGGNLDLAKKLQESKPLLAGEVEQLKTAGIDPALVDEYGTEVATNANPDTMGDKIKYAWDHNKGMIIGGLVGLPLVIFVLVKYVFKGGRR